MRKIKVLHVLNTSSFSGAENVVCQIAILLREYCECIYVSMDGPIREVLKRQQIAFAPVQTLSLSEIRRVIRENQPDIIHAHDMRAGVAVACACGHIPMISHIHNNSFDSRGISIKSCLYGISAWKAKHIFWVSRSSMEGYCFHRWFQEKSSILLNVIDTNALVHKMQEDTESYQYDLVYLGRLTPQKNPQRLLHVMKLILEQRPQTKMAIIGTGEMDAEIKLLAAQMKLIPQVTFLGFMQNPYKVLRDAKVMLMTSRWEGTPMVALEAQALGVPIVSTPTDGLCDVVQSGMTGFLSDDDDELASACVRLICGEKLQAEFSEMARKKSEHMMDLNTYRCSILSVYEETLHMKQVQ